MTNQSQPGQQNKAPGQKPVQNKAPGQKPGQQQGGGQEPGQQSQAPAKGDKNHHEPHDQRSDSDT